MTDHPGDVLSAYLDAELGALEREAVEAHLAACITCQRELATADAGRGIARGLADVAPPDGFFAQIVAHGPRPKRMLDDLRPRRIGWLNVAAAAAAWILVIAVGRLESDTSAIPATIRPFLAAHASILPTFRSTSPAQAPVDTGMPSALSGSFTLLGYAVSSQGVPHAVYSDGVRTVSMFTERGRLDVSSLPLEARPIQVNARPAWRVTSADGDVVFMQNGYVVVILVAADDTMVEDVASESMTLFDDTIIDRAERAGRALLETFGLRG